MRDRHQKSRQESPALLREPRKTAPSARHSWRARKLQSRVGGSTSLHQWKLSREQDLHRRTGPLVVVDFFCGGGGFTCGALEAGAIVACGIDCDERVQKTYQENNHNRRDETLVQVAFVASRIEELESGVLFKHLKTYRKNPLVFVGCPPCQPFTNLRTCKEKSEQDREALAYFIDHVRDFKPDFVVIENVPGIRAKKYDSLWEKAVNRLRRAGYRARHEVVNAARYGVPQKRLRTLLVACRTAFGYPPWPEETHQPDDYRTVQDAFAEANLCKLEAGESCKKDPCHAAAKLSEKNLQRIAAISRPGGSRKDWPDDLSLDCYEDHDGHTDVYGRMDWEKPAPTLTTRFISLSNGRFGHPEENRAITPREGALLQTFPADYEFYDTLNDSRDMKVGQIGNAVPPRLAKAFIKAIHNHMTDDGAN